MKKQLNAETWKQFTQYVKENKHNVNSRRDLVLNVLNLANQFFNTESYNKISLDVVKLYLRQYNFTYLSKLARQFNNKYNPRGEFWHEDFVFIEGIKTQYTLVHTDQNGFDYYATYTDRLIIIHEEKMIIVGYNDRY